MKKRPRQLIRVIVPDSHGAHIDPHARRAFLADVKRLCPDEIVFLGDHLDAGGTFSAHQRNYTNEMVESYAVDVEATNALLDEIQKYAPRAVYHYLEGNHEAHVERWAAREFERRADAELFVEKMGPGAVLRLRERGIRYYKSSTMYQNLSVPGTIRLGKCYFTHGISASRHAAYSHVTRFGANVVFGHVHRAQAVIERTVTSAGYGAWCPGTLAKLQPLYRHTAPTSWSHGYGLQFVQPSGQFLHMNIPIVGDRSLLSDAVETMRSRGGK